MISKQLISRSLPVAICVLLAGNACLAQDQPSLETPGADTGAITPLSDMVDQMFPPSAMPLKPAEPEEVMLEVPTPAEKPPVVQLDNPPHTEPAVSQTSARAEKPQPQAEPLASELKDLPAEPAVEVGPQPPVALAENPAEESPGEERPAVIKEGKKPARKNIKPVSFSPVPAIAIFPVIKTGNERAFSDLPVLFAREVAQGFENYASKSKIYHPVYTVEELRLRGLGHIYDKVMKYYLQAGRPEPAAMDYMLKQLSSPDRPITRVVFVEADLDMNHQADPAGLWDRVNALVNDASPAYTKYHVRSRLQVFNTEVEEMPRTWSWSWDKAIKTDKFYNVTPSVFADSDSQQAFAKVSRQMTREIMVAMTQLGKRAYMDPQYDTSVTGQLAEEEPFPNFTEQPAGSKLNDENREAIERILRRQNSIAP